MITTFISPAKITEDVSTFSDTLTFTTDINFGANPSVELKRLVPKRLNLTSANIDFTAKHSVAHVVKTGLKIPEPEATKQKTTTSLHELLMMKNPFSITESEEKMSLRQGLEESRRLEGVDDRGTLGLIRSR